MKSKVFVLLFVVFSPLFLSAQKDSTSMDTLLQLSLEQLMNVKVVTASGFPQTAAEAPSTITVITAEQIKERGYEQLEDALRDIPGIDMIHLNGYAPTLIYFRGMYGAENLRALLMIDGIVENNLVGTNDFAGPAYSLHNVDRIEIIWGPASALYGANAFGGVINIITKKGADINGFTAE
jgi:outer membrane receptor for ferrienterochelin and colicin